MLKICFIQEVLKDCSFLNDGEKINFQILKALSDSEFQVNVFCKKNNLSSPINLHNITELETDNFFLDAISIANGLNYDLTFSTDYLPTDIVYLHQHTHAYHEEIVKNKLENLLVAIFQRKKHKKTIDETNKQTVFAKNYKAILTPSTVLKNDLINLLQIDGQKIYILPPTVKMPEQIETNSNTPFSFGFIGKDFYEQGGLLLLCALNKLKDFDFKLKIISSPRILEGVSSLFLKITGLNKKIEFYPEYYDLNEFYNEIDALIIPEKHESFGLNALEAMSYGKIVVLSSRCGAKDIIDPDNNGFIFDITKNATGSLSRILKYILSNQNDFTNLRQKAIFTASVYNYEKFKTELIRILEKFAKNKGEN